MMNNKNLNADTQLLEILVDPVRAQIYFEAMVHKEITAKQLMEKLTINRSTLTHHLTKMVQKGIFEVRVQSTGRPIKYYRIKKSTDQPILIERVYDDKIPEQELRNRITILESAIAHLQVITTTTQRMARQLIGELKSKDRRIDKQQIVSFSFSLLASEEAEILNKKYMKFLKEIQDDLQKIKIDAEKDTPDYLVFSGIVPIIK
jgi:DNA-binding transcriptional ArsR family regulator